MIDHLVRHDFKAVDKRDGVGSVFGYVLGENKGVPIVCDRGKPFGVLNERRMLKSHLNDGHRLDAFVIGTRTVPPEATVEQALDVAARSRIPHVPVTRDDRLVGYVRTADLLKEVDRDAPVAVLATPVQPLARKDSVGVALHRFKELAAHVIPVVDDAGRVTGVVQRRDILALGTDARPDGRKSNVGEVDDPRRWPVEGYVHADFQEAPANAAFRDVRDALIATGFVVVVDDARKPRGVVTAESAAAAILAA